MEIEETKKTALDTSVGADERQSLQNNNSIPEKSPETKSSKIVVYFFKFVCYTSVDCAGDGLAPGTCSADSIVPQQE